MASPPRDIDMTSQVASSEGGAGTAALIGGKTQSVVQMNSHEEFKDHSEYRKYSTTTTTHQVITTQNMQQESHHSRIAEANVIEEGELSSGKKQPQNTAGEYMVETTTTRS